MDNFSSGQRHSQNCTAFTLTLIEKGNFSKDPHRVLNNNGSNYICLLFFTYYKARKGNPSILNALQKEMCRPKMKERGRRSRRKCLGREWSPPYISIRFCAFLNILKTTGYRCLLLDMPRMVDSSWVLNRKTRATNSRN